MGALLAFLVTLLAWGPAVADPSTGTSLGDVNSIEIHATLGGLGGSRHADVAIRRRGDAFLREDGAVVSAGAVGALLDALAHPSAKFDFSRTGFDRAYLRAHLDDAELYLGDSGALPAARDTFESLFLNTNALDTWFEGGWMKPLEHVTDYAPRVDATIVTASGRILAASNSQNRFMLPIVITDASGEHESWDPGLARALGMLMPDGANRNILLASNTAMQWGGYVAASPAVQAVVLRDGIESDEVRRLAASAGFDILYEAGAAGDPTFWSASVWRPQVPRVRYLLAGRRSSAAAFTAKLNRAQAGFTSLRRNRWFASALERTPQATLEMDPGFGTQARSFERILTACGRLSAAAELDGERETAIQLDVEGENESDSSRWVLFANGDLLLLYAGTNFPYGAKWYAGLPTCRPEQSGVLAGVVVHPDGSIER